MTLITLLSILNNGYIQYHTVDKNQIKHTILKTINGICDFQQVDDYFGYYHDSECGEKRLKRNHKAENILKEQDYHYCVFGPVVFVGIDKHFDDTNIPPFLGVVR